MSASPADVAQTPDPLPVLVVDDAPRYDFGGDARVLETYISYLRRKLDADGPPLVHTVRGVGYVLRMPRLEPDSR